MLNDKARAGLPTSRNLPMRKPNYRFERAERDRVKKTKKEEKLQRQQERAAERAADRAIEPPREDEPPD